MAFPVLCGVIGRAGEGSWECNDGLRMGLLRFMHSCSDAGPSSFFGSTTSRTDATHALIGAALEYLAILRMRARWRILLVSWRRRDSLTSTASYWWRYENDKHMAEMVKVTLLEPVYMASPCQLTLFVGENPKTVARSPPMSKPPPVSSIPCGQLTPGLAL